MAGAAGDDLLDRESPLPEPLGVVLGLQIAGEQHHALALVEPRQRALQQRGLARARRTDQVHHQNPVFGEALAQLGGDLLILIQNFLFNRDLAHASPTSLDSTSLGSASLDSTSLGSTSTYAICSSSPATVMVTAS